MGVASSLGILVTSATRLTDIPRTKKVDLSLEISSKACLISQTLQAHLCHNGVQQRIGSNNSLSPFNNGSPSQQWLFRQLCRHSVLAHSQHCSNDHEKIVQKHTTYPVCSRAHQRQPPPPSSSSSVLVLLLLLLLLPPPLALRPLQLARSNVNSIVFGRSARVLAELSSSMFHFRSCVVAFTEFRTHRKI